jgi:hypothetical protein
MSYMRGPHYLWRDDARIHLWSAAGYDGWDQSIWAHGRGVGTDAVPERPDLSPSGVALPQAVADEYVLLRLAELLAAGTAVATLDRALERHAGNGGAVALGELAPLLRRVLGEVPPASEADRLGDVP